MTKIKKKDKQKEISIKKFDRMAIMKSKIKNNINELNNKTKEKYQDDDENAEEYAENKISKISKETISNSYKLNKIGKKNRRSCCQITPSVIGLLLEPEVVFDC